MKTGAAILAICASIIAAAPARAAPKVADQVQACLLPSGGIEDIVANLAKSGWMPIPAGAPAPEFIELLIWPQAVSYFTVDSGGEVLSTVLELQRKTVSGFARKKDLPQSKTRILTRTVSGFLETVVVLWRQPTPKRTETTCRFAMSSATISAPARTLFDPQPGTDLSTGDIVARIDMVLLDQSGLAIRSGTPVTVSATIETTLSFPSKE